MFVISGNFDALKKRQLDSIISSFESKGYRVEHIGEDFDLDNPFLPDLCFFVGYDFKEPELYKAYDNLVLYYSEDPKGNTKAGKFLKTLKKDYFSFVLPDQPWELKKVVAQFLDQELKRRKMSFSGGDQVKSFFLEKINYDPGILLFELDKFQRITTVVEPQHIKDLTPDFFDQALDPLLEAIGSKSKKMIAFYLHRLYKNSKSDPSMMICKVLQSQIVKWLVVLDFMDTDKAAEALKANPWFVKNKIAPTARNLGRQTLIELFKVVNDTEKGILLGYSNIPISLQARLLQLF